MRTFRQLSAPRTRSPTAPRISCIPSSPSILSPVQTNPLLASFHRQRHRSGRLHGLVGLHGYVPQTASCASSGSLNWRQCIAGAQQALAEVRAARHTRDARLDADAGDDFAAGRAKYAHGAVPNRCPRVPRGGPRVREPCADRVLCGRVRGDARSRVDCAGRHCPESTEHRGNRAARRQLLHADRTTRTCGPAARRQNALPGAVRHSYRIHYEVQLRRYRLYTRSSAETFAGRDRLGALSLNNRERADTLDMEDGWSSGPHPEDQCAARGGLLDFGTCGLELDTNKNRSHLDAYI